MLREQLTRWADLIVVDARSWQHQIDSKTMKLTV